MKKPEIMSPIRNFAGLEACRKFTDAVYFGASDLSMRARANDIKLSEIKKIVSRCHKYRIKAYLTVNCAIYNSDIKKAEKLIKKAKEAKIDAIIVWDNAVIEIVKREKIKFFISTQANISNSHSVKFYKRLGAKRIVLAREMTLKEIKEIKKRTNIEIEVFVHGAMCFAVSGRCILSSYLFGKSANCGSCSQPCRKEWILSDEEGNKISNEGKYFMNSKDLCMISHIPKLIKAGINSFKIEGRKRDPKYIEVASRCYREAVDSYFDGTFTKEKVITWEKDLALVYNRGFSTGFYFGDRGKEGISYDKCDNISKSKKIQIGVVVKYYPKIKVVSLKLLHNKIKLKDKLLIEGKSTFFEEVVSSMQVDNKDVVRAKKGEEASIKTKNRARKGDNVYIIKN